MRRRLIPRSPAVLALLVLTGIAAALVAQPQTLTLVRNSFIAVPGAPSDFTWVPDAPPDGYKVDDAAIPRAYRDHVERVLSGRRSSSELERALTLATRLGNDLPRGGAIQSNSVRTLAMIQARGGGYCADFTQVFQGLARTAGIPAREWGMSFGRFDGDGHAFIEIYDRTIEAWVFVDVFYGFYVRASRTAAPLSVAEFFASLRDSRDVDVVVYAPHAFRFKSAEQALSYYRRGIDHLMLVFGNNVFAYDANPFVAAVGGMPRIVEQLTGIVVGAYPGLKIVPTPTNRDDINRLKIVRYLTILFVSVYSLLVVRVAYRLSTRHPG